METNKTKTKIFLRNKRYFSPIFSPKFIIISSIIVFLILSSIVEAFSVAGILIIIYIFALLFINKNTSSSLSEIIDFKDDVASKIKAKIKQDLDIEKKDEYNYFLTEEFSTNNSLNSIYYKWCKQLNKNITSQYVINFIFFDEKQIYIKNIEFSLTKDFEKRNVSEFFYNDVFSITYGDEKNKKMSNYFSLNFINGEKKQFPIDDDKNTEILVSKKIDNFKRLLREKKAK